MGSMYTVAGLRSQVAGPETRCGGVAGQRLHRAGLSRALPNTLPHPPYVVGRGLLGYSSVEVETVEVYGYLYNAALKAEGKTDAESDPIVAGAIADAGGDVQGKVGPDGANGVAKG